MLSRLISKAYENNQIKGIRLAPSAPPLTHLFFVDGAILFAGDSAEEVYHLISVLSVFTTASGQKINTAKSGIICGQRVNSILKAKLMAITSITIWANPGQYLGVPTEWGRARTQSLNWVKERVLTKMEGWKGSLLTQAGK